MNATIFTFRNLAIFFAVNVYCLPVAAQQGGITLQLPTYRTFRVSTTVSVPDRGGAYLGGVNSGRSSRQRFGSPVTPGGVAIGNSRQSAGVHVSAFIQDHQEMDRALLGEGRNALGTGAIGKDRLSASSSRAQPLASVAEIRAQQETAEEVRHVEAENFYQQGLDAVATGKPSVARIHFQMAARRASGDLKQRAATELERLERRMAGDSRTAR
jgi:hypothetical protein